MPTTIWTFSVKSLETAIAILCIFSVFVVATPRPQTSITALAEDDLARIVRSFTAKEAEFSLALNLYAFKREALIQSVGMGGQVTGEYRRISHFTFDEQGHRYEKLSHFPMPSFGGVTAEDLDELGGIQPFPLTPSRIDRYDFRYAGKERIDELNLHVFDVTPKVIPDPRKTSERLFNGRIWVEDQDLQIVKTKGKGVPDSRDKKFPTVETYREQIDGRYWFPTYSFSDEELVLENRSVVRVRMRVRYSEFRPARADVKITEMEEPEVPTKPRP